MTEAQYINATNLAKVRAMMDILRSILPDGKLIKTKDVAHRQLRAWEKRLDKSLVIVDDEPESKPLPN